MSRSTDDQLQLEPINVIAYNCQEQY